MIFLIILDEHANKFRWVVFDFIVLVDKFGG